MNTKENNPISLEEYFSHYTLPYEDVNGIIKFLGGDYEAIKNRPQLAHIIFNVLDPHVLCLMSKKRIERDKQRIDNAECHTQLIQEESEELFEHSYDLIARRTAFHIVEKALVMAEILDSGLKFKPTYGNLELVAGVAFLLYEKGYFKKYDRLGIRVSQSMVLRAFQDWYETPSLQKCWRFKSKCIEIAEQKFIIITELERNYQKKSTHI